jgi:hypothetical protein
MNLYSSEKDINLEVLMNSKGYGRIGSGFGFGARDMEFKIETALNQDQINALAIEISKELNLEITLSQDAWHGDERDDDGPIEGYSLLAEAA